MERPKLYLTETIRREQNRWGSFLALEKQIAGANANLEGVTVDRRKLKAIADGAAFTISTDELLALDNYFSLFGEGLADRPLFVRQSVLEELAQNSKLIFLLGAFPRDDEVRNDVNLWDVKAYQDVLFGVHRFHEGIQNSLQEIPFLNLDGVHNQDPTVCDSILQKNRPNACGIGSPRASVATEIMLAHMFGTRPFRKSTKRLPFKFVWPHDEYRDPHFVSAFEATPEELESRHPAASREKRRALIVNGKVYEVTPKARGTWSDYGIIALQRQADGRIWLVLAGVTGPATYACAIACRTRMNVPIPSTGDGPTQVLWALIHLTVGETRGIGDIRCVQSVDLVEKPQLWPKRG